MKEIYSPIPDRKHLKSCRCGKRPRVGTTYHNQHRVACMKLKITPQSQHAYGCGQTTCYHMSVKQAEADWNKNCVGL